MGSMIKCWALPEYLTAWVVVNKIKRFIHLGGRTFFRYYRLSKIFLKTCNKFSNVSISIECEK